MVGESMGKFSARNLRFLYLLALFQLVGGPLVLLQLTVFCKVALHEAPHAGMAKAAVFAWQSGDFQAALAAPDVVKTGEKKSGPVPGGPKLKLEKAKMPIIPWEASVPAPPEIAMLCKIADRARVWTPAWPQAPPGPPPRMG